MSAPQKRQEFIHDEKRARRVFPKNRDLNYEWRKFLSRALIGQPEWCVTWHRPVSARELHTSWWKILRERVELSANLETSWLAELSEPAGEEIGTRWRHPVTQRNYNIKWLLLREIARRHGAPLLPGLRRTPQGRKRLSRSENGVPNLPIHSQYYVSFPFYD